MGNCHPCRMDTDQVMEYRSKQNEKARKKDMLKHQKQQQKGRNALKSLERKMGLNK